MRYMKFSIIVISLLFLSINLISAIDLLVTENTISDSVISDLNIPAVFNITITNLNDSDNFTIYSLVGVDITPVTSVYIANDQTRSIIVNVMPRATLKERQESIPFEYQIKNSKNEVQKSTLLIKVTSLEGAFMITPGSINPQSNSLNVEIKNLANYDFENLNIKISSAFFNDYTSVISLKPYESKNIMVPIDKEKLKILNAGNFILNTEIVKNGKLAKKDNVIKFVEQQDIESKEINDGLIIARKQITKKNIGNMKQTATVVVEKSLFSYLFTTVNPLPSRAYTQGLNRIYEWNKNLNPDEELLVIVKTNWLFPIGIIILIIVLYFIVRKSIERDMIFRKNVSYVRTKGGEFALKVTLNIKAKKAVEKINITDRLPHLVNLYEKFGATAPDKVDTHNKRLEWNVEAMNAGEERMFSYIIYSHKVGVVGRFELPNARLVYEKNGKIKETTSNRAFFINEPKHSM